MKNLRVSLKKMKLFFENPKKTLKRAYFLMAGYSQDGAKR